MGDTINVSPVTGGVVTPLVDAATVVWAANQGYAYSVLYAGSRFMQNPSGLVAGTIITLTSTQGGSGSYVPTWGTNFRFPGGVPPTFSTAVGAVDVLQFYTDGTLMYLMSSTLNIAPYLLAPSALTASTNQAAQITLGWTNNATNATGVRVQRLDGVDWVDVVDLGPAVAAYVDSPLDPGLYDYRILAFDTVHTSLPSNTGHGEAL